MKIPHAPVRRILTPVLRAIDRRFADLTRAVHHASLELRDSLHTKSIEWHESLHVKSEELHATLHVKSDEVHASLNPLHERTRRIEDRLSTVVDAASLDRLSAEVGQLRADIALLGHHVAAADHRWTSELRAIQAQLGSSHETYLESLTYVGRTLREVRDEAARGDPIASDARDGAASAAAEPALHAVRAVNDR